MTALKAYLALAAILPPLSACHAADRPVDLKHAGQAIFSQPVRVTLVEARDNTTIEGRLVEQTPLTRRFADAERELSWTEARRMSDDALEWTFALTNHAEVRRGIDLSVTFTLPGVDWTALFTGVNDRPEWPDNGSLRYVYIRSQDTSDKNLASWNAYTYLTIPFGCLYDAERDIGVSFVGEDLDFPYYTVTFEAKRTRSAVEFTITHPQLRLEAGGARTVSLFAIPHAGDWRPGLGWMRERWRDSFDVPDYAWKMHTTSYTGTGGAGGDRERVSLTDGWWHNRLKKWRWRNRGMVQSRGFDMWYGMWAPDHEPWHVNMGHKYRNMIERPGDFPNAIIEKRPETTAPWREQVEFVEKLNFKFSPSQRAIVNSVASSLYAQWERSTHDDVGALLAKIHSMGWYAISHYDLGAAWAPWLQQEFPESAYPGTFYYEAPIWSMPDPFPGSRWRAHIIDQVRQLFEIWPDYDGIMLDQMYYEAERATAQDGTPVDDGITVAADGSVASNLIRNNASTLAEIKKILAPQKKVIWGNHARTYFCMTRNCDMLVTEGTATPGAIEDSGKWMTIGSRGCHGLHASELQNQNCVIRGWTTSLYIVSGRSVHAARRNDWEFFAYPYFSLMEMLPGTRWVLTPHALDLPSGMVGNIFRRPDGNVLVVAASYGTSVSAPWWRSNVPVKVRLEDAGDIRAAHLLAASHLGPKKLSFTRNEDEIAVTIPRHRSVSMVVLAKTGRFLALAERNIGVVKGRPNEMTLHLDNWTDTQWDWKGELLTGRPENGDDFLLVAANPAEEEGGAVFDGVDAFGESPALSFGRDDRRTINLWFRTDKGGTFLDVSFVKDSSNFFEFLPGIRRDNGSVETWAYSMADGERKDLSIPANADVRDSRWHMYTFAWEGGPTIKARAYLDGSPVRPEKMNDTLDLTHIPWNADQTQGNTIGRGRTYWHDSYRIYRQFDGAIDDVAVFDQALSDAQVRTIFAKGRNARPETLSPIPARLWTFDTITDSGTSPAWTAGTLALRESRGAAANVAPQSSETVSFALLPDEVNTVDGFTRFTLDHDLDVVLPKPDALPGSTSTFEAVAEPVVALSLAPPEELVDRSMSNGPPFHKGSRFIQWAQPLSLNEGETATFHLMVANHGAAGALVQLSAAAERLVIEGIAETIEVAASESASVPIRVRGETAGAGKIAVTATTPDATETTASLTVRIAATALAAKDLAAVKSVRMIFDSWYSPGAVGAKITLNGVEVGKLPGNGTYGNWTVRQPFALADNATQALAAMNKLIINTAGRHFKMRNVALECTLADGRVAFLAANETRPQSVPADWPAAEGIRHENGQDMVWHIPIEMRSGESR